MKGGACKLGRTRPREEGARLPAGRLALDEPPVRHTLRVWEGAKRVDMPVPPLEYHVHCGGIGLLCGRKGGGDRRAEPRAARSLQAVRREGAILRVERGVIVRMVVARADHRRSDCCAGGDEARDWLEGVVALWDAERAARHEIVLHVNREHRVLRTERLRRRRVERHVGLGCSRLDAHQVLRKERPDDRVDEPAVGAAGAGGECGRRFDKEAVLWLAREILPARVPADGLRELHTDPLLAALVFVERTYVFDHAVDVLVRADGEEHLGADGQRTVRSGHRKGGCARINDC